MQTLPRKVIILLAVVLVGLVAISAYSSLAAPSSTGPWKQSFEYPLVVGGTSAVVGQSCVDSAGYVYCVGGEGANQNPTNSVYYSPASSVGVGNWTASANPYPQAITFESCASASGYVYCVGGQKDSSADDTNSSYFAPLTPSGVGPWAPSTPLPGSHRCAPRAWPGWRPLLHGRGERDHGTNSTATLTGSVWFAPISSSGVGTRTQAADYPARVFFPSCTGLGSYVYCVAGEGTQDNPVNSTYYSYVTSSGMGPWTATSSYPIDTLAESCVTSYSLLYCIGGLESGGTTISSVYFASASSASLGQWQAAPSYPLGIATDCVAGPGLLYCVGGYESSNEAPTGDSYYALLNATAGGSSSDLGRLRPARYFSATAFSGSSLEIISAREAVAASLSFESCDFS